MNRFRLFGYSDIRLCCCALIWLFCFSVVGFQLFGCSVFGWLFGFGFWVVQIFGYSLIRSFGFDYSVMMPIRLFGFVDSVSRIFGDSIVRLFG